MQHDQRGDDRGYQSDSAPGDGPDLARARARRIDGAVDAGWLRPHTRPLRGRPRASTVVLVLIFIAALLAYLELRPGG
ncbi:hypothetical protein NDR87_20360 [Nocardia sp. CDC159]|uniref:Uncharacterized protein n=1 Tax=Nocardia pulmonis TaxID=2951408 RepID=A0A9X2E9W1_9NOCA|nr:MULTISPECIES: hypothetical protein [Nocardia]MCM6776300.1 hypothetical protein [Nocardia pulmonis]MCM6788724.1 hypothetical protein [Nocardia sp. CDC159]